MVWLIQCYYFRHIKKTKQNEKHENTIDKNDVQINSQKIKINKKLGIFNWYAWNR